MSRRLKGMRVFAALAALACGTQGTTPIAPDGDFTLQQAADSIPLTFRKDAKVGDVWMTFTAVPSDSRCATGVQCVWAGDAIAEIAVHPGCYKEGCKAASQMLALHTNLDPKSGTAWGHRVTLLSLLPHPVYGTPTDSSSYVAWIRVN